MRGDADHTRRWLIHASGATILSNALAGSAPAATPARDAASATDGPVPDAPVSAVTAALSDYVADASIAKYHPSTRSRGRDNSASRA